jgi:hypothetical protein
VINKNVIVDEICKSHSLYYSLRGADNSNFDINIQSVETMGDKQLIELLKILKSLIRDELEKY